jgi:hypothetical protein
VQQRLALEMSSLAQRRVSRSGMITGAVLLLMDCATTHVFARTSHEHCHAT